MDYFEKLSGKIVEKNIKNLDLEKIKNSYIFCEKAYNWKKSSNWKSFIFHSTEVAILLLDLKPDTSTIISVFIYDTMRFANISLADIKNNFWRDIWKITSSLLKVSKVDWISNENQSNYLCKMFIAIASDLRVVLIKLANRLYRLKNIKNFPEKEQKITAKESLEIYAPVAERLGIFSLKTKIEDFSFKILHPKIYSKINSQVVEIEHNFIWKILDKLSLTLDKEGFKNFELSWRTKWKYSIYKKMLKKWVDDIYDLYDILAIRIFVDSIEDCYKLLWVVHKNWKPIPNRFKDYIAIAKDNWYRSLHTVVIWMWEDSENNFRPVEVQIRTKKMHFEAEYWVASHWSYKEWVKPWTSNSFIENIISLESEIENSSEFLNQIQIDSLSERIFVLTPNWEIKNLPIWANPIDFAFSIHRDIWLKCIWAKVNNKNVPLFTSLNNGDTVKIITREWASPSHSRVSSVKTNQAKNCIKKWINDQDNDSIFKNWQALINKSLKKFWKEELDPNLSILKNFRDWKLNKRNRVELVEKVWKWSLLAIETIKHIIVLDKKKKITPEEREKYEELKRKKEYENIEVLIEWEPNHNVKLLKNCCDPVPWDKIIWYVTRWLHIWIHKKNCPFIFWAKNERFLRASRSIDNVEYLAKVKIIFDKKYLDLELIFHSLNTKDFSIDEIEYKKTSKLDINEVYLSISFQDLNLFSIKSDQIKKIKWIIDFKIISLS